MPSGKQTERVFFLSAFDVLGGEASLARVTHNTMFAILLASAYLRHSPFGINLEKFAFASEESLDSWRHLFLKQSRPRPAHSSGAFGFSFANMSHLTLHFLRRPRWVPSITWWYFLDIALVKSYGELQAFLRSRLGRIT
jgi:hypothetical protein